MKRINIAFTALFAITFLLSACNEADVVSQNISTAADQFQVNRRIDIINGITDKILLEASGYCSLGNHDQARELSITCKVGPGEYRKFFAGLSDNVTYTVAQIDPQPVNEYHYKVIWRPESILPDIDIK